MSTKVIWTANALHQVRENATFIQTHTARDPSEGMRTVFAAVRYP